MMRVLGSFKTLSRSFDVMDRKQVGLLKDILAIEVKLRGVGFKRAVKILFEWS